ncbi:hypothetical protein GDO86_020397 [Hymenochirus boettgeri]|uniref:Spartan-like zinc binding domain-containing protein n=1 Tax=Hymenochirus boettgeri TaxID=247094 RepID=A0A8T2IBM6_9PIPI|nr:hypothetical protein GDO86_020397 [Hymenochirus boettgeri]
MAVFYLGENIETSTSVSTIVDPIWGTRGPNLDINKLFGEFNVRFFGGKLPNVEVKWNKRMTVKYEITLNPHYISTDGWARSIFKDARGILHYKMALSKPILELRPRKDTVEEYDCIPPFHNELETIKRYWWQCDGPCKEVVKRATNRAPSYKERSGTRHTKKTCGGKFERVPRPREPEEKKNKKKRMRTRSRTREERKGTWRSRNI